MRSSTSTACPSKLRSFFREHELPKRVRLGVASQKIAVRVIELPKIDNEQELEAAVRFQAQEELPMPLEQAVLAHRVLERLDDGENPRMRVLVVGARRDSVNHLLAVARRAGLNPELVDLSAFAMIRALYVPRQNGSAQGRLDEPVVHQFPGELAGESHGEAQEEVHPEAHAEVHPEAFGEAHAEIGAEPHAQIYGEAYGEVHQEAATGEPAVAGEGHPTPGVNGNGAGPTDSDHAPLATVYCYIGGLTNLAIAVGTNCVFNRVLHNGIESMAATLAERKGLTLDHSREWLRHVGLDRDLENIEGERAIIVEAREVLENGARRIADEVRLSMEYYHSTVPDAPRVETAVMAGPGIADGRPQHALRARAGDARGGPQHGPDRRAARCARRGGQPVAHGRDRPRPRRGDGVRPVNLIPPDQRKGAARAAGESSNPVGVYVFFGVLGVALLCSSRSSSRRTGSTARPRSSPRSRCRSRAPSRSPMPCARTVSLRRSSRRARREISTVASTRFNWERSLRQLSRAIPEDVWLLSLAGTLSPQIEVEDSGRAATRRTSGRRPRRPHSRSPAARTRSTRSPG